MRRSRSLHGEYFLDRNFRRPSQHPRRLPSSFRESISDSSSQGSGEHRAIGDNLLVVICLGLLTFTSMASMSIIAPFFPNEASKKGMTETVSGLVFAVYGLVVVIMSPIVGKIIPYLGLRFVLISGILLNGVANILFGILDQTQGGLFTFFAFTVRGVEALGAASTSTACFTYLMQMFPQYIGTAFGIIETCVGLGMSLGPAIGGFLYTLGGYSLPFFALGILVLANIPFCWYIIKPIEDFSDDSKDSSSTLSLPAGKSTYWSLISIPSVFVVCLVIVVVSSCLGFLDPTVEPHFRQYDIGAQMVGLVFLVMSAAYAVFSPVVGYIAGKTEKKFSIMFVGLVVTALGLLIVGPSPFTGIDPGPWISTAGMVVIGLANAIAFIPTFETIILIAIQRGFQDDVTTYGLVSGLWSSMNALGDTIGPALGGFLFENFGFPQSATIMAWCCLTVAVLVLCVCCCITERLLLSKSTSSIGDAESGDHLLPDGCRPNSCTIRADGVGSSRTTKDADYKSSFFVGYQALAYGGESTKYNFNPFTDEDVLLNRKVLRSGGFFSQSGSLTSSTEKSKLLAKDVNSRHYGSNDPNV